MIRQCQRVLLAVLAAGVVASCGDEGGGPPTADDFSADVAVQWFDLSLQLVRETPGFSPPVASRAFGYMGVALYESVVGGLPEYRSLEGQLDGLSAVPRPRAGEDYYWPAAANAALAEIMRDLFPAVSEENGAAIAALEATLAQPEATGVGAAARARSAELGRAVAGAVFEWSKTDGGHEAFLRNFPTDYVPPTGPGNWVSTPPGFQRALQPYWGNNRPFALGAGDQCDPGPPPPYSEDVQSDFYREAMDVYDTSASLTEEQRTIALFWGDDPGTTATPPGHSISILTQTLQLERASLALAAESYAKVGMAVADAFISCWNAKFEYNLLRPVTYIQQLIDPIWTPLLNTPPFPEYTSGHSVQSGAAAQVMTDIFGAVAFTDHTHDERGLAPRTFSSFFDAAEEAAISRLFGGIHYLSAIEVGSEQGKCVGSRVSTLRFR